MGLFFTRDTESFGLGFVAWFLGQFLILMGNPKQKEHKRKRSATSCQRIDKLLAQRRARTLMRNEVYEIDSIEESETLTISILSLSLQVVLIDFVDREQLSSVIDI